MAAKPVNGFLTYQLIASYLDFVNDLQQRKIEPLVLYCMLVLPNRQVAELLHVDREAFKINLIRLIQK